MNDDQLVSPSNHIGQHRASKAELFQGIDLANSAKNTGYCVIADDGNTLSVQSIGEEAIVPVACLTRRALDCHFGYPAAIMQLLKGLVPSAEAQKSQQFALWRQTEDWFSDCQFPRYTTKAAWAARSKDKSSELTGDYFNKGSHIVPATGMRVIPRCLAILLNSFESDISDVARQQALCAARRGEAHIVESHPRLFLYSLLERIHREVPLEAVQLGAAAKYKQKKATKDRNQKRRQTVLDLLVKHSAVAIPRTLLVPNVEALAESDHHFDAFLSALTAWAHHHDLTASWGDAKIPKEIVKQEGHISVLRTDDND